ncbi:unnamed protein product [Mycena citricolor]|uniref:Complex III subunit 7 n=1 Tax=Mycena citricolor TaxID=2018698 RepID=A0AAD2GVD0_9AGAR|nr:unnamed protein product [Mycena citricolor]CAK5279576.1 unnamed protein product [Mycena citricolor]
MSHPDFIRAKVIDQERLAKSEPISDNKQPVTLATPNSSITAMAGPLGLSFAPYIRSSPTLSKIFAPAAKWYAGGSLYRQYGLLYDDLLIEERPEVQKALARLTPREAYDRQFRIKRASQADVLHAPLSKDLWTKPEDDIRYLLPHVEAVESELKERASWDSLEVHRKH